MQANISDSHQKKTTILIISVFIAGLCSIIYELLISTASSYFLGNTVKQFSITIGLYMAAMGLGSYLSRMVKHDLLSKFIGIEILLGFLGGISIPSLYFIYAYTDIYYPYMIFLILAIGILIGMEIPFLTRLMEKYYTLNVNISNVLSVDYVGALIATLLFPFILLPFFGTFKSSLFFGIINMGIGYLNLWCFSNEFNPQKKKYFLTISTIICLFLVGTLLTSRLLMHTWSNSLYEDRIIFTRQTTYQKIVITKNKDDIRLFIDGNLQFSSIDEYRYHESLVHIPMGLAPAKNTVLLLGGGDGLAARELLKYPEIKKIIIVDIDPEITKISREINYIKNLNTGSLNDKRVEIINDDAMTFLENSKNLYDIIISDLPDPNNHSLARLYSLEFYKLIKSRLARAGIFVTQATSPFFSNNAFWCIYNTIDKLNFKHIKPYHAYVPSFGDWGFIIASRVKLNDDIKINVKTRYLDNEIIKHLFIFEKDLTKKISDHSTMDKPVVLDYYLNDWKYWN